MYEMAQVVKILCKNSVGVMIFEFVMPDSRKSLSPVSSISALVAMAARSIGLSETSRTSFSSEVSITGAGTTSRTVSASARKRSRASIL